MSSDWIFKVYRAVPSSTHRFLLNNGKPRPIIRALSPLSTISRHLWPFLCETKFVAVYALRHGALNLKQATSLIKKCLKRSSYKRGSSVTIFLLGSRIARVILKRCNYQIDKGEEYLMLGKFRGACVSVFQPGKSIGTPRLQRGKRNGRKMQRVYGNNSIYYTTERKVSWIELSGKATL